MKEVLIMMKKILLAMLCLLLLPACAPAEAAEPTVFHINDSFDIAIVIPDHYTLSQEWYGDIFYARLTPQEETIPEMIFSLGVSEEYTGRSINDLDEQELQTLIDFSIEDFANPTYAISETSMGTKLIIVDENSEHDEYAEIFTVYDGFFTGLLIEPVGDSELTAEQIQAAVDLLSDMEFIAAQE